MDTDGSSIASSDVMKDALEALEEEDKAAAALVGEVRRLRHRSRGPRPGASRGSLPSGTTRGASERESVPYASGSRELISQFSKLADAAATATRALRDSAGGTSAVEGAALSRLRADRGHGATGDEPQ